MSGITVRGLAIAALVAVVVAACDPAAAPAAPTPPSPTPTKAETAGERMARLYEAAKAEGKLALYSSLVDGTKVIFPAFEARFPGIRIDQTRASKDKLVQKIVVERRAGQELFDVLETAAFEVKFIIDQGFTQKYRSQAWNDLPEGATDKNETWIATRVNYDFPAFNTTKVGPGDIKTWKDLCDERYQARFVVDQGDVVIYTALRKILGEQEAQNVLRCVAANKPSVRSSHTEMMNFVAAGEVWAAFSTHVSRVAELKFEKKAPVDWVRTDPTIAIPVIMALSNKPPHPNAAALFMEWYTSPEGQKAIAETGQIPASTKTTSKYPGISGPGTLFFVGPDLASEFESDAEFWRRTFGLK